MINGNKIYPSSSATGYYLSGDNDEITLYGANNRGLTVYSDSIQPAKNFYPWINNNLNLGASTRYWANGYISNLYISSSDVYLTKDGNDNLTFTDGNAGTITLSDISSSMKLNSDCFRN